VKYRMAVLLWLSLAALACRSWAQDEGGDDNPTHYDQLGHASKLPFESDTSIRWTGFGS
jgi:hypothetical protein